MPHEVQEKIEEAEHHGGSWARWIGVTIAVLGVLMAVCSALLGAARTELIAAMVDENGASHRYQTASSKYRMLQAQLQQLHALMPNPGEMAKTNAELAKLKEETTNPETKRAIQASELQTTKILSAVIPTREDMLRFAKLIANQREQTEAAEHWTESYHDAIAAYARATTYYEIAQVAVEIGIVIASVALLLSNLKGFTRGGWFTAIALGVISMSVAGVTMLVTNGTLHHAEERIAQTRQHFFDVAGDEKEDLAEDEKLIHDIEQEAEKPAHP